MKTKSKIKIELKKNGNKIKKIYRGPKLSLKNRKQKIK